MAAAPPVMNLITSCLCIRKRAANNIVETIWELGDNNFTANIKDTGFLCDTAGLKLSRKCFGEKLVVQIHFYDSPLIF